RHAPPWWPANEPWPPDRSSVAWRSRRARFVRRAAFAFAIVMVLSVIGAARLVSWIAATIAGGPVAISPAVVPLATVVALLLALCVVRPALRRLALPMGDIIGAANRVADGDFSARVAEHGPRSLRVVARAFNVMAARLQSQEQQRRHLMADIAHELRTPLTVI